MLCIRFFVSLDHIADQGGLLGGVHPVRVSVLLRMVRGNPA